MMDDKQRREWEWQDLHTIHDKPATLPDEADTQPVAAPMVYVVIQQNVFGVHSVFTSTERLLEAVNAQPGMEAWLDEYGHPHIKMIGSFRFNVIAIELDVWE